jgi:hypothetical protein
VVAGCSWEVAAIRRGVGSTAAHVLRVIAWLMVSVSLFAIASQIHKGSQLEPAGWLLALQLVPLVGGFVVLLVTFRVAGYSKRGQGGLAAQGRHAQSDTSGR